MKNLSVAMIVAQFPNIVQTYIVSTITGVQKNNARVTVIAGNAPDNEAAELIDSLPENTPDELLYINTEIPQLVFQYLTLPLFSAAFWRRIGKISRSSIYKKYGLRYFIKSIVRCKAGLADKFDIIHSHNLTLSHDYLFYKEIFSSGLVTTFHGKEPKGSKDLSSNKKKQLFEYGDVFLVNTVFAKNSLLDEGCPEEKIRILPQGTTLSSFSYKERSISSNHPISILTVGRLSIEKGQHVAIQAMSVLAKRYPNIRYHLVGSGPENSRLKELVNKFGLQGVVVMHGYVSNTELADIYAGSQIFVLPSVDLQDGLHVETQGVVLQEAQASGLVVVASNAGGIPEVIKDKETGILFESGNPDILAEKLAAIISDPALFRRLARNGRKDVKNNYDSDVITSRLRNIYDDVLKIMDR